MTPIKKKSRFVSPIIVFWAIYLPENLCLFLTLSLHPFWSHLDRRIYMGAVCSKSFILQTKTPHRTLSILFYCILKCHFILRSLKKIIVIATRVWTHENGYISFCGKKYFRVRANAAGRRLAENNIDILTNVLRQNDEIKRKAKKWGSSRCIIRSAKTCFYRIQLVRN